MTPIDPEARPVPLTGTGYCSTDHLQREDAAGKRPDRKAVVKALAP